MVKFPSASEIKEEALINTILQIVEESRTIDEKYSEGVKEKTAREQVVFDIINFID